MTFFARLFALLLACIPAASAAVDLSQFVSSGVPHPGSDQILWVPTLAQAELAARETGRMILVMGSVSDRKGY